LRCQERGADPPGTETCRDRFHALLAGEAGNAELRQMHGLTVLTYYLQHPSLTKPWYQVNGAKVMRRVFGQGENWFDVLLEAHPRGVGRRQSDAAVRRLKAMAGPAMPDWVITHPILGERTVVSVDLDAAVGQAESVMSWARSVAEHRFLGLGQLDR
jgi:hypothetical protein